MTNPSKKPSSAAWREQVRAELLAGGVSIETLPSGLVRIATRRPQCRVSFLGLVYFGELPTDCLQALTCYKFCSTVCYCICSKLFNKYGAWKMEARSRVELD